MQLSIMTQNTEKLDDLINNKINVTKYVYDYFNKILPSLVSVSSKLLLVIQVFLPPA